MRLTRRIFVALTLAAVFAATPAYADDEPAEPLDPITEQTRAHHRRGLALYDEGDYRLALVEFERAYEISKNYKILFNIGQVHYELKSYAKARRAFEEYLARGGDRIDPARRADVERDLATLRTRTATITVRTNVPDAEIAIDDAALGRAPIQGAVVDAGTAKIKATKPGYATVVREITLVGGDAADVSLELHETKPDVVVTHTTSGVPVPVVVGWIATGVLAAGTIGTALAANAAHSDYERQRDTPISGSPAEARADLERQRDLVGGLAVATDVLALATLVAGGISLYLTLREPKRDAPRVAAGLGNVGLRFGF